MKIAAAAIAAAFVLVGCMTGTSADGHQVTARDIRFIARDETGTCWSVRLGEGGAFRSIDEIACPWGNR